MEGVLLPPTPPSLRTLRNLIPHGHRRCHSLGYNFIHKMNTAEFKSATFPNAGPWHLLDDSVMEPHTPSRGQAESSTLSSGISIGSSDGSELSKYMSWPAFERNRLYHSLGPVTRVMEWLTGPIEGQQLCRFSGTGNAFISCTSHHARGLTIEDFIKRGQKANSGAVDQILSSTVRYTAYILCSKIHKSHRKEAFQVHIYKKCFSCGLDGDDG